MTDEGATPLRPGLNAQFAEMVHDELFEEFIIRATSEISPVTLATLTLFRSVQMLHRHMSAPRSRRLWRRHLREAQKAYSSKPPVTSWTVRSRRRASHCGKKRDQAFAILWFRSAVAPATNDPRQPDVRPAPSPLCQGEQRSACRALCEACTRF